MREEIKLLDTVIAAHALARNLLLVTNNQKEFSRVPELKIENWVRNIVFLATISSPSLIKLFTIPIYIQVNTN
jgi:hypothetical protein